MENQYSAFRKSIKKRLIDIDRSAEWLCAEVAVRTGKYFDSSYLSKIYKGTLFPEKFVRAICEILNLSIPDQLSDKQDR